MSWSPELTGMSWTFQAGIIVIFLILLLVTIWCMEDNDNFPGAQF